MEDFVYSTYNVGGYPGYLPFYNDNAKFKYHSWNKKGAVYASSEATDYFELCKRAHLKTILSQVNPNLTPRLRKANTKEFGVQVNPKIDAVVQCSLGPKTLFSPDEKWASPVAAVTGSFLKNKLPGTPINNVRFSRPVAIYSPVFDRTFFSRRIKADEGDEAEGDETCRYNEDTTAELQDDSSVRDDAHHVESGDRAPRRFGFQFLEQKYGFFHCCKCNIRWESAYVWCISGTCKVYFKQQCRKCQRGLNPYRVEPIQCQVCCQIRCNCEKKQRHVDMRRPHRQDLCGRCRGKRLSCDTTYSFKYIV